MASITITIPDAQAPRLVADVAQIRGVDITAMNLAQKVAFLKADLQSYWQDMMNQAEVAAAGRIASDAAIAAKKADIVANLTVT